MIDDVRWLGMIANVSRVDPPVARWCGQLATMPTTRLIVVARMTVPKT
jgi:hypothetical protein